MVLDQIGDDHNADFSKPGTAQDYGNITHGYHGSVGFMCSILAQSEALKTLKYHWLPKTAIRGIYDLKLSTILVSARM